MMNDTQEMKAVVVLFAVIALWYVRRLPKQAHSIEPAESPPIVVEAAG
jgi:hypothetical protein